MTCLSLVGFISHALGERFAVRVSPLLVTAIRFAARIELGIALVIGFVTVRWRLCENGNGVGIVEGGLKMRVTY